MLKSYCVLILLLLMVYSVNSFSQDIELSFHHVTEESGLTSAKSYLLYKDTYGLLWIGTENGLLRFDGLQITKFQPDKLTPTSISESIVTSSCYEDKKGDLWFTTTRHVNCYQRSTNSFVSYRLEVNDNEYKAFYLSGQGVLWVQIGIGRQGALYYFDLNTKSFTQAMPLEGELCHVVKKDTTIVQLLSTSLPNQPGMILTDINSGRKQKIDFVYTTKGVKRQFASPTEGILVDRDSIVWVGTYNGMGRYRIGAKEGFVEIDRTSNVDVDVGWVWDIVPFDQSRLLVAASKGLLVFDKVKSQFVQQFRYSVSDPYSLQLGQINRLYLDEGNNIWVSGTQQELAFANLEKHRFPKLISTAGQYIQAIKEDRHGNVWCSSTESGVFVFNQDKELIFRLDEFLHIDPPRFIDIPGLDCFITSERGEWWANVDNTYLLWNDEDQQFEFELPYFFGVSDIATNDINCNYQLNDGTNLIAKNSKIYELELSKGKADTISWYNVDYLQLGTIRIIYQDSRGYIYLGDNQGRLIVLEIVDESIVKILDLEELGMLHSFLEEEDKSTVWIAGSKGLATLDVLTQKYQSLSENNGSNISSETYYNILKDDSGNLWLPGNNGLVRYNPIKEDFHRFGRADGLYSLVFNKGASMTATQSGEFWVGGKNGINVFDPSKIDLIDTKPRVRLANVLVNDEPYDTSDNLNVSNSLVLPYDQNTLSFEFTSLDYSDPSNNSFRCQLIGYDDSPVELGRRNFIRYGNLPPGKYTCKTWGSNSDRIFSEWPFEMSITIIPPFYQTWWFYLLCILVAASITYTFFRYRLEQALKVERLRVKISSDLHDDVGGLLSGLAMQTEILENLVDENVKPKLRRIGELSRRAMSRMRDTVWAIDARKDKLENLIDRMNEHAEETLSPKDITYDISIQNLNLNTLLPTDIRQNVYLIYKEAITNAAKHSNGDEVTILLTRGDNQFMMRIMDNGNVAPKNYKTSGSGIGNMKMRTRQLGGSITLSTENGYQITLKIKSF